MNEWLFGEGLMGNDSQDSQARMSDQRSSTLLDKKAERIMEFILEVGNFGHNRDMSYYGRYPYVVRKAISAWWRVKDLCRHARIIPLDSLRFSAAIMFNGVRSAVRGE